MTTIAVKDGFLAVDTLVTAGNENVGYASKWRYSSNGDVMAWCGEFNIMKSACEWYDRGAHFHEAPQDILNADGMLVVLTSEFDTIVFHQGRGDRCNADCFAFGSGSAFARGAMEAGASAYDAVVITTDLDIYTGGDVECVKPLEISEKKKPWYKRIYS